MGATGPSSTMNYAAKKCRSFHSTRYRSKQDPCRNNLQNHFDRLFCLPLDRLSFPSDLLPGKRISGVGRQKNTSLIFIGSIHENRHSQLPFHISSVRGKPDRFIKLQRRRIKLPHVQIHTVKTLLSGVLADPID